MQFSIGIALSCLSAVLYFLSMPPFNMGYLAWIALVPVTIAQFKLAEKNWQSGFFLFLAFAIGGGVSFYHSLPSMNLGFGDLRHIVALAVSVVSLFVFTGMPSGSKRFHEHTHYRYFIILPICGWVGLEFIRYSLELGQMWCMFFVSQHQNIYIMQLASLAGIWLVSAVVVAVNYLLGFGLLQLINKNPSAFTRYAGAAVGLCLATHLLGWSLMQAEPPQTGTIKVAAIQKGLSFEDSSKYHKHRALSVEMIGDFEKLTKQLKGQDVDLVVWPESVVWVNPNEQAWIKKWLSNIAKRQSVYLVVPYISVKDRNNIINEAMVFSPEGEYIGAAPKDHPIKLPNYYDGSATRGQYPVFDIAGIKVGILLGYDIDFTDTAKTLVNQGAELLVVPMHDRPSFWQNQFLHNQYRAIENRVATVRADWRHASTPINAFGQPTADTLIHDEASTTVFDVPVSETGSLYTRIGNLLGYFCAAGFILFFLLMVMSRLRS